MTTPELEAQILRLYHAERWRPGTIARQLSVSRSVVRKVLERNGAPKAAWTRSSKVDDYVPFIIATLKKYPRLTAVRLHEMVQERGYEGGSDHFRALVRRYRPRRSTEAYLRLKTLAGDQAQVDWGLFGKLEIGKTKRPLVGFVMVLSYSRAIFLRFFPTQQLEHFLAGHQEAFERWGGVPRTILYDNLKSVVVERVGDAIQFNDQIHAFSGHYRYEPRPVAPYRGNEKGRVERAIRYARDNFIPARSFTSFEDINAQADQWCTVKTLRRPWQEDREQIVADALERDRAALRPLPDNPFPCEERVVVSAGKTPYVRFDLNDYSIPHTHVEKSLVVLADLHTVRILEGADEIARHKRSFERDLQIEDVHHIETLAAKKRHAGKARRTDVLAKVAPSSAELLQKLAERHQSLGRHARELHDLLQTYGAQRLEAAIQEALENEAPHPQAVRHVLERDREAQGQAAALPLPLPDDPRFVGLEFTPHSLKDYDDFFHSDAKKEEDR